MKKADLKLILIIIPISGLSGNLDDRTKASPVEPYLVLVGKKYAEIVKHFPSFAFL